MKKVIREGAMSDIDIIAGEAASFKEFVKEFYKEYKDFPKTREAMKWLEDTYKNVNESTDSNGLERVADGLPQTMEESINELTMDSAGVKEFLRALYRNTSLIKKMGFSNFKSVVDYIKSSDIDEWDDLRNDATKAGLRLESTNEETKRDYKDEYKKFQSSDKSKKYRAELNKYNRDKGTYGNGDGKDASHKGGKIVGFEAESTNRGRAEKSRLKKEVTNTGGKDKSEKNYKDWKSTNNTSVNEAEGLWANIRAKKARGEKPAHGNSDAYKSAVKSAKKINKEEEGVPHYTENGEEWKGKVHKMPDGSLMSGNPHDEGGSGADGKSEKLYHKDDLNEDENPCWKGYEMVGMKTKNGKEVPNCVPKNEAKVNEGGGCGCGCGGSKKK